MELVKLGERTYYIKNNTNIGVYLIDDKNVYLVDSGIDKDTGKKILKIIDDNEWNVLGIINTHSHADHIGGNQIIKERTGCKILSYGIEKSFMEETILEPSILYGGNPFKELKNKFLMANNQEEVLDIRDNLPNGLDYILLPGHSYSMIGIKTSDGVCFLGDALASQEVIDKYHIFYLFDVVSYLNSLDYLEKMSERKYILSHMEECIEIGNLIKINREKVYEIGNLLIEICQEKKMFDEILKEVFSRYGMNMSINQYVLIGSTIKAYLTWLKDEDKILIEIDNNYLYFKSK